jgi:hypothetical protein
MRSLLPWLISSTASRDSRAVIVESIFATSICAASALLRWSSISESNGETTTTALGSSTAGI